MLLSDMSNIQKISIALPPEMVSHIKEAVEGGAYSSASEVIREALRDWKEKQAHKAIAVRQLKRLWNEGVRSGAGRFNSMEDIKAEARRRFEASQQRD